jgi:hypothetical protein
MNTTIADTEDGQKCVVGATALKRRARLEENPGASVCLAGEATSYGSPPLKISYNIGV